MDFEFLYIIYEYEFILYCFEVIKKKFIEKFFRKCYCFLIFYFFLGYSSLYFRICFIFIFQKYVYFCVLIIDVIKFNVVKKLSLFNILIFDRLNNKLYIIIIEYILNFRLDVKVYIMQCKKVFQIQLKY